MAGSLRATSTAHAPHPPCPQAILTPCEAVAVLKRWCTPKILRMLQPRECSDRQDRLVCCPAGPLGIIWATWKEELLLVQSGTR